MSRSRMIVPTLAGDRKGVTLIYRDTYTDEALYSTRDGTWFLWRDEVATALGQDDMKEWLRLARRRHRDRNRRHEKRRELTDT